MRMTVWMALVCLSTRCLAQNQSPLISMRILSQADSLFFKNQWKEAIPLYEQVMESGNPAPLNHYRLGYSRQQMGNYTLAKQDYFRALAQKPQNPVLRMTFVNLAKIYGQSGQVDSCTILLSRALEQGYANLLDLEKSPEFDLLRTDPSYAEIHDSLLIRAYPCKWSAEAKWFDFWVGEWNVYVTGTINQAGYSKIEKIAGDCAILENWTSAAGNFSGKSINFYNTLTSKWEQHWIGSAGGYQKFDHGEFKDGAMRFSFTRVNGNGSESIGRFIFYNQGSDQVRQFSESSKDQGQTWIVDYDFTYKRIKT